MLYVRTHNEWLRESPNAISGGKDEYGNDIVLIPAEEADVYDVVLLSKEDIANHGYDPTGLTREDMRKIADNIGETLCCTSFWDTLDYWCERYKLPRIEE